jgi:hypothetical protein
MRSDHLIPLALYKRARRMASEDSARTEQSFLLIVRTRHIVTAEAVARDSRIFQQIAGFYNYHGHC